MKLHRLVLLLLLPLGCADVLGLDGLTYESAEPETVAASGGTSGEEASGGTGAGLNAGIETGNLGDPLPTDKSAIMDDFPATWPEGTLFAFEPGVSEPYYFAYEPEAHRLSVLKVREGDDLITRTLWAEDLTWTQLVVVSSEAGPVLRGYDPVGLVERVSAFDEQGGFSIHSRQAANPSYSHLTCIHLEVGPMLFAYDENSGNYRGVPALSEQSFPIVRGQLQAGRSKVTQMIWEGDPAVAFLDQESGTFEVFRIPTEELVADAPQVGIELQRVADGSLAPGEQLVGFYWEGEDELFVYGPDSGESHLADWTSSLGAGGAAAAFEINEQYEYVLRRDLEWIETIPLDGGWAIGSFGGTVLEVEFIANIKNEDVVR